MARYDHIACIPNWLIFDMKGEKKPMINIEKYGNELVATSIWLLAHQLYGRTDFTIRFIMEDYGIDTTRKPNKEKWISFIKTLVEKDFMCFRNNIEKITIDTRIQGLINESIFSHNEDNERVDYAIVSLEKLDKIYTLPVDRIKMVCIYGLSEIMCYRNPEDCPQFTKGHRAEVFWGKAENLANMVNISRKTWEEYTEILKQNNILLHKSYYKGTSRHTTYGFDWENIEQGINYFVNDKKQENCTESLEDKKDKNNIEKDRRVIQLRRRIF